MMDLTGKSFTDEPSFMELLREGFDNDVDMGNIKVTSTQAIQINGFSGSTWGVDNPAYLSPFDRHTIVPVKSQNSRG